MRDVRDNNAKLGDAVKIAQIMANSPERRTVPLEKWCGPRNAQDFVQALRERKIHQWVNTAMFAILIAGVGTLLVILLSGCALHFHYHGTTAPAVEIVTDNENDNADARLREILGVE